jgi:ABC-type branched-subunit amino acid transport system permease subunit
VVKEERQYRKKRLDRGIKARADTIFVIASWKDLVYLFLPRAVPVIALLILPLVLPAYWGKVLVFACVYGLLALSWDFLGSCGLFSLGQALFFGMGAYLAGHIEPLFSHPSGFNHSGGHGGRRCFVCGPAGPGGAAQGGVLCHGHPHAPASSEKGD